MLRILVINSLMFVLPFLIYGAYFYLSRSEKDGVVFWSEVPLLWLLGASTFLVFAAMILLVSFSGAEPGGTYIPPSMDSGIIQPGHIK